MFPVDRRTTELMAIETQKKVNEQRALDARCKEIDRMCRKAEKMSSIRDQQFKLLDEEDRMNALKAKEARERQMEELERDQNLARAMEDLKRRETAEVKNKQLFQTNCHELQRVDKQLRTAYAQKELLCQIKENEALKKEEKVKEYYEDLKMIESGKSDTATEIKRIARENEFKSEYKMAIEKQMQEMNERRRRETAPPQLGCSVVFEPTENCRKLKQDLKINRSEKETEELKKIRNELKEREREEDNKMNRRINEYLTDVEKRTKNQEEIKNKMNERKDRVYKYLADNLISSTTDTSEKDEIRTVLAREQQRNAVWLAERREKELKKLRQEDMLKQNDMQLKLKEDGRKDEKEKDLAEAKKHLQSYRELNAVTEKKDRDRRQATIDYRNDLKELIDVRNDLRIERKTTEKNEFAQAANLERLRLEEIEKEQKCHIDSHADALKGFFSPPKNYCSRNYEK